MTAGGTYALLLYFGRHARLQVGSMGSLDFPGGYYLYLGSALGGLKARVSRHLRQPKALQWHIDYLAARADIIEVWWQHGREKLECRWAAVAAQAPGASQPAVHFGSSDCGCLSHLVHFPSRPSVSVLGSGPVSTLDLSGVGAPPMGPLEAHGLAAPSGGNGRKANTDPRPHAS